ncbi:hypothetical protein OROGR_017423 [Orobanche gracilis]
MSNNLRFKGRYPYSVYTADSDGVRDQVNASYNSFSELIDNVQLDSYVKWVALGARASPSVVSLKIYSGEQEKKWGSGFIISCDDIADGQFEGIVITSASLLKVDATLDTPIDDLKVVVVLAGGDQMGGEIEAVDNHFNIAAIKIQSGDPLKVSRLREINDCGVLAQSQPFVLRPHSELFQLTPGTPLLSLGCYYKEGSHIMVAPGCGIGGPTVNEDGEVIGMNFYALGFTPFLPINIIIKWWKLCKRGYCRPYLGVETSNLFTLRIGVLEKIMRKFPDLKVFEIGIIVDEVAPDSPAGSSGLRPSDIIIRCDGADVRSSLQFFDVIWDKVGKSVELVAITTDGTQRTLNVVVADTTHLYRWPIQNYGRL